MTIQLADGYKYALLALPRLNAVTGEAGFTLAEEGYALATSLPVSDVNAWRPTLGWYRFRNLAEAGHYLMVYAPSKAPDILNKENKVLARELHRFHLGVMIACPFIAHDEAVFLEGARCGDFTNVRGHTTYPQLMRIAGGPSPFLRTVQLTHALALGRATQQVRRSKGGDRFGRVLTAFRMGLQDRSLDTRVHQFVRCIEAFVGSWHKEEFADNALELLAGVSRVDLLQAYAIRSAVEHFGGWQRAINVNGRRAKQEVLITRAIQTQGAAHYLLTRFLESPQLWPHYQNESTVSKLRRSCCVADRVALWGPAIDLSQFGGIDARNAWEAMDQDS